MPTTVAFLSSDRLAAWLEPVSCLLHAARCERRLMIAQDEDALTVPIELEALKWEQPATPWRALIVTTSTALAEGGLHHHHVRLDRIQDALAPAQRWFLVLDDDPQSHASEPWSDVRERDVIVRMEDPRLDSVPHRGRVRLAMILLALTRTNSLEPGRQYEVRRAGGDAGVDQIGGIELRTTTDGSEPTASDLMHVHMNHLRTALESLAANEPRVPVDLLDAPQPLATKGDGQPMAFPVRPHPKDDPMRGWLREPRHPDALDWRDSWSSWRARRENHLSDEASALHVAMRKEIRRALDATSAQHPNGGPIEMSRGETLRSIDDEKRSVATLGGIIAAAEATLEKQLAKALRKEGWTGIENELSAVHEARPTRRQVIVSTLIGVAAITPSAILQISTLTAAVSLVILLGFVLGVVGTVARRLMVRVRRVNDEAHGLVDARRAALEEAAKTAARLVESHARRAVAVRNLARLNAKRDEIDRRHQQYTHHRAELERHAQYAAALARSLSSGATPRHDRTPRPPEEVVLTAPAWCNPVYALQHLGHDQGRSVVAELRIGARQSEELDHAEFAVLRRIEIVATGDPDPAVRA